LSPNGNKTTVVRCSCRRCAESCCSCPTSAIGQNLRDREGTFLDFYESGSVSGLCTRCRKFDFDLGAVGSSGFSRVVGSHALGSRDGSAASMVDGSLGAIVPISVPVVAVDNVECTLERVPRVVPVRSLDSGLGLRVAPIRSMVSRKRSSSESEGVVLSRASGLSGSVLPGREIAKGKLAKRPRLHNP